MTVEIVQKTNAVVVVQHQPIVDVTQSVNTVIVKAR